MKTVAGYRRRFLNAETMAAARRTAKHFLFRIVKPRIPVFGGRRMRFLSARRAREGSIMSENRPNIVKAFLDKVLDKAGDHYNEPPSALLADFIDFSTEQPPRPEPITAGWK
jgi:hypothetical protein